MARLILLPGLGADARLFAGLGELCLPRLTPSLPPPHADDDMPRYAQRVAATLDPATTDYIGGCSFGSLVAAEIARQRPVAGLVLLAGATSSATVNRAARWLAALTAHLPIHALRLALERPAILRWAFGLRVPAQVRLAGEMLRPFPDRFLIDGARLATNYFPAAPVPCPVYSLHGDRDHLMRPPGADHIRVIAGAGHGLALTHASQSTEFLREALCPNRS